MTDREKLIKTLRKEIKTLEKQIKNIEFHNSKIVLKTNFIKTRLVLNRISPFVLAGVISFGAVSGLGFNPFSNEKVKEKSKIEYSSTSTGLNKKSTSYDREYNNSFYHTTGWELNKNGLYERTVTYYELDTSIDLSDIDNILSMSKEEIEDKLNVINIEKIQKSSLSVDDEIYNEDMVVVTKSVEDEENYVFHDETFFENLIDVGFYLIGVIAFGLSIRIINKKVLKIDEKLNEKNCLSVEEFDIDTLLGILEMKKHNLEMLEEDSYDRQRSVKR